MLEPLISGLPLVQTVFFLASDTAFSTLIYVSVPFDVSILDRDSQNGGYHPIVSSAGMVYQSDSSLKCNWGALSKSGSGGKKIKCRR